MVQSDVFIVHSYILINCKMEVYICLYEMAESRHEFAALGLLSQSADKKEPFLLLTVTYCAYLLIEIEFKTTILFLMNTFNRSIWLICNFNIGWRFGYLLR